MDTTTNIKANILYFEGYSYVEFNGEYFMGCKRCGGTVHYMFDGFDRLCYLCRYTDAELGDAFANEAEAQKWCHGRAVRKAQADEVITEFESDPSHCDDEGNFSYYTYGPACWFLGTQGTDEQGVKGRRITFTATLEQSRDDASFGFGSRPTKGAWL